MKRVILLLLGAVSLGLSGCQTKSPRVRASTTTSERARFYLETISDDGQVVTLPRSGAVIEVQPKPVLTEYDIVNVELAQVELGYCLMFQLTPAATRDLYQLTAANPGERLVLMLSGVPFGARRIAAPLDQGMIFMFIEAPDSSLPALVASLKKTCATLHPADAKP